MALSRPPSDQTQTLCYIELFLVSQSQPSSESDQTTSSNDTGRKYTIVAVAVAMYLMLSIAAADLWGGFALVMERRDSGGGWYWRRKVFGVFLLSTFVMLVAASTRVLFYSSFEDFEVVIGAAAVLFIADVVRFASGRKKTCCLVGIPFIASCWLFLLSVGTAPHVKIRRRGRPVIPCAGGFVPPCSGVVQLDPFCTASCDIHCESFIRADFRTRKS